MSQLNGSFGSGGMTLSFNDTQFSAFIQQLKNEGNSRGLPIKSAACNIGMWECMGLRGRHSGVCGVFHMVILSNTDYTIHTYLFLCRSLLMVS